MKIEFNDKEADGSTRDWCLGAVAYQINQLPPPTIAQFAVIVRNGYGVTLKENNGGVSDDKNKEPPKQSLASSLIDKAMRLLRLRN
jgi:hypothetical protein